MNEAELLVAGKRQFQRQKLIKDAPKNWDHFYKRHGVTFFKDRHWTQREFADLMPEIKWEVSDTGYIITLFVYVAYMQFV